ncbi:hypothetical protein [Leptospira noguchii]|uniref:hypothetical protein n=1 Tax=Leptospira noguchii TaxID=28182 RepID=UPI000AA41D7F|nr:hypothetical protein [Leptospira noguchii]
MNLYPNSIAITGIEEFENEIQIYNIRVIENSIATINKTVLITVSIKQKQMEN